MGCDHKLNYTVKEAKVLVTFPPVLLSRGRKDLQTVPGHYVSLGHTVTWQGKGKDPGKDNS